MHSIFDLFENRFKIVKRNDLSDFVGVIYSSSYAQPQGTWEKPIVDDEYFEWIDTLCSVVDAKEKYVYMELGAGYGRWAARAYKAATAFGLDPNRISLTVVESEPQHVIWLKEHLAYNNISEKCVTLNENLISSEVGFGEMVVISPDPSLTAKDWYGQAKTAYSSHTVRKSSYLGHELFLDGQGWGRIRLPMTTLCVLLENHDLVNLIDMDIQGEELSIVKKEIALLNEKVMRVHIGTHSKTIDCELFDLFTSHGWSCVHNYGCGSKENTKFGGIQFQDGVQGWLNPKFPNQTT